MIVLACILAGALAASIGLNIALGAWARSAAATALVATRGEATAKVDSGDLRAQLALAADKVVKANDAVATITDDRDAEKRRANRNEKEILDAASRPPSARPGADSLSALGHVPNVPGSEAVPGGGAGSTEGGHGP